MLREKVPREIQEILGLVVLVVMVVPAMQEMLELEVVVVEEAEVGTSHSQSLEIQTQVMVDNLLLAVDPAVVVELLVDLDLAGKVAVQEILVDLDLQDQEIQEMLDNRAMQEP